MIEQAVIGGFAPIQTGGCLHPYLVAMSGLVQRLAQLFGRLSCKKRLLTPFKCFGLSIGLDVAQLGAPCFYTKLVVKVLVFIWACLELLLAEKYPRAQQLCVLLLDVGKVGPVDGA